MDERLLASSFGAAAAAYAQHRPDYAHDAVRWALQPAPGLRVLDLGAGTGKLTATFVAAGADVVAVEPDAAMLAELRSALPQVSALPGSAESIPLPDAAVDAVLAGNAMHWFDMAVAGPEIARVLAPNGVLAGLWNVLDDTVDWVRGLAQVAGPAACATHRPAGARKPRTRTFRRPAGSPGSARRSRLSSGTASAAPRALLSRRSARGPECSSCPTMNSRPRPTGSALTSRADRRPRKASSPSRC